MFEKKNAFTLISIFLILNSMINRAEAVNCWTLTGGTTTLIIPSATAGQIGASSTCAAGTCKRTIYQSAGFSSYPLVTFQCVDASTDADDTSGSLSCKVNANLYTADGTSSATCTAASLLTGCTRTLTLVSSGTSITTYCSQQTDGNKNIPSSCYIGSFSVSTTNAVATANTNQFCINTYSASTTGASLTVTGSQADTCQQTSTVQCCSTTNCNNVLFCYVGQYNSITTTMASTFAKATCHYSKNSWCKNVYSYSPTNGLTVTGTCESSCTPVALSITSQAASGTTCSSSSYGNAYGASSTIHNEKQIYMSLIVATVFLFKFFNY